MKKLVKKLFIVVAVMGTVYLTTGIQELKAVDPPTVCKWKQIDCEGWFNGSYEACLTNGDGNTCTCGTVTRDCESGQ